MANTYFQFKQFLIEQGNVGMKVTTDGCYFGAIFIPSSTGRILDIGAGTGLLSLMATQRAEVNIDALELNADAYSQAKANFNSSPWPEQLSIIHTSLQEFQAAITYDQIICNPPFFVNSQAGQSKNKNQAVHAETLSMEDLAFHASRLLKEDGEFWVMYPAAEMEQFISKAESIGFKVSEKHMLRNKEGGPVFRLIVQFRKVEVNLINTTDVFIKESDGSYSRAFSALLKDFYLHL